MTAKTTRDPWVKKAKWLTQALIISGTLNVGLLSTFIYSAVSESKHPEKFTLTKESIAHSPQAEIGLKELVHHYASLTFQELVHHLKNTEHVESGYTRRDIALAALTTYHHFNLERALGGPALQKRTLKLSPTKTLTIYPGLADYQYQAILQYANTEKWPYTSEGLFLHLQNKRPPYDPSLIEALTLTPEFHFINRLFTKTGIQLKKEHTAHLLAQAPHSILTETTEHLSTHLDFTVEERRRFLLQLTSHGSKLAAKVLLETDADYCLKHLNNDQVVYLCDLLGDNTSPSFLKKLLDSPRPEAVWQKAASLLYVQAAEEVPATLDRATSKRRFLELKTTPPPSSSPLPSVGGASKTYTVRSGDSLWKIAREHKTTVSALRAHNNLKTDNLRVGQKLKIP